MTFAFDLTVTMGVIVALVIAIVGWVQSGRKAINDSIAVLTGRLDRHEARIAAVEQTLTNLPARSDLHQLQLSLSEMHGELREMRAGMVAAAERAARQELVVQRVEQYLLEGART